MPHEPDARHASILIVDDHQANLLALEAVLGPLGQPIVRASSGEEALKLLLDRDFAVILLDVQMPGLDGFQTAQLIKARERTRHIPIIFLTAYSRDARHVWKGYQHGAVDYLLKPYDPEVLVSKVAVFVELFVRGKMIERQAALLHEQEREALERRNELRQRALVDHMPLLLWTAAQGGAMTHANRGWLGYTGIAGARVSAGELVELGIPEVVHEDDRDRARAAWRRAAAREKELEVEVRLRRHDGAYRWHMVRATGERDETGAITGWICTGSDIDDQKAAEDARVQLLLREQEARAEAEAANRAKDEFLATVSHELRTPLNAILGWVRMLRGEGLDEAAASRALETIERNARAQKQLIEDILDVSRIVAGKLRLEVQDVDLRLVVQSALDSVRPAADAKGVAIGLSIGAGAERCAGDPERLQQIAWNLLANAIKFTPEGGRVDVRLEGTDTGVALRVSDTGVGISPDFLPFVFERFRQADGSSSRTHAGLGLGLAIVRHLVEQHGGSVDAKSAGLGHGAVFTVRLPIRERRATPAMPMAAISSTPAAPPAPRRLLEGVRVLVVDDSEDARALFTTALARQGACASAVGSAEEAMRELATSWPDVLLSDIGLPREDGYALIRKIRLLDHGRDLPAAALTAFSRSEDLEKALAAGFHEHIAKPVDPQDLVSTVARLARRRV